MTAGWKVIGDPAGGQIASDKRRTFYGLPHTQRAPNKNRNSLTEVKRGIENPQRNV